MYHIDADGRAQFVSVKLAGLLTVDEVNRYIADMAESFNREKITPGYLLMIDTTEATLQTQEVVGALQQQIAKIPKAKRIAIVNGSSLARMQIRRVMTQEYMRLCASRADAMAWLIDGKDVATSC